MKRIITALLIFMLLILTACGGTSTLEISFANDGYWGFTSIRICEYGSESTGSNLLKATDILEAGETAQLTLASEAESGLYDIRCNDEDEDIWLIQRVPLSKGTSLSVSLNSDGVPLVVVADNKGITSEIVGEFEGELTPLIEEELQTPEPTPDPIPAPSEDDPLDMTYDLQSFPGGMLIPYPSTMQVLRENAETRTIWLDAINDPDFRNNICVDFIEINAFDKYFNSGESQARVGLDKLFDAVIDISYKDYYINSTESEFINGGSYYGLRHFIWLSGDYYVDSESMPIRGVLELRYYGPTGYLMCVLTTADEGAIERYYSIALGITDSIPFGGDWSTEVSNSGGGSGWSDPGDWDYDPWSDPGDGDDAWSDPGDTGDWSDTGDGEDYDYGDYEVDPWSDPGDN